MYGYDCEMFLHDPPKLQRYLKLPLLTIIGILSIIIAVGGIYLEMTGVHERKPLTPRPLPSKYSQKRMERMFW